MGLIQFRVNSIYYVWHQFRTLIASGILKYAPPRFHERRCYGFHLSFIPPTKSVFQRLNFSNVGLRDRTFWEGIESRSVWNLSPPPKGHCFRDILPHPRPNDNHELKPWNHEPTVNSYRDQVISKTAGLYVFIELKLYLKTKHWEFKESYTHIKDVSRILKVLLGICHSGGRWLAQWAILWSLSQSYSLWCHWSGWVFLDYLAEENVMTYIYFYVLQLYCIFCVIINQFTTFINMYYSSSKF